MFERVDARRLLTWVFAAGPGLFCVRAVTFHGVRHGDAHITFRYAQNLATGRGMVFNRASG